MEIIVRNKTEIANTTNNTQNLCTNIKNTNNDCYFNDLSMNIFGGTQHSNIL